MKISRREFTTSMCAGLIAGTVSEGSVPSTELLSNNSEDKLSKPVRDDNESSLQRSDVRYLPLIFDY